MSNRDNNSPYRIPEQTEVMDFCEMLTKEKRPDEFERLLFAVATEAVLRNRADLTSSEISDYQSILNADTDEVLAVTLKSYTPVSNREIMEFFEKSMDEDGIKHKCGFAVESCKGRKTVFEIILPDMKIDLGNGDTQEMRLYVTNSFDGKTSVRLDMGFFRHACSNMALMIGNADIEYRTTHTGDAQDRIQTHFLHYVRSQFEAVNLFVNQLSVYSFPSSASVRQFIEHEENTIVSNRDRQKVLESYFSNYYHDHGMTLWSVYNAYTHIITHTLKLTETGRMKKLLELSKVFKGIMADGWNPKPKTTD